MVCKANFSPIAGNNLQHAFSQIFLASQVFPVSLTPPLPPLTDERRSWTTPPNASRHFPSLCHTQPAHLGQIAEARTCEHKTQPYSGTGYALFKLLLGRPRPTLAIEARLAIKSKRFLRQWYLQWKHQLDAIIETADNQFRKSKTWYQQYFDAIVDVQMKT